MKASDLMDPSVVSVRGDDPVQVAVARMMEHDRLALPVVDDAGGLVGIVRQVDILDLLLPDYLDDLRDLSFIPNDVTAGVETPEAICRTRISEVVQPETLHVVDEDEPIVEVARLIVRRCLDEVPVTSEGRLVGMISSTRLLRNLLVCATDDGGRS